VLIACRVSAAERDAWSLARERLRERAIELRFVDSPDRLASQKPDVVAISLVPELDEPRLPISEVAEDLRGDVRTLRNANVTVFLCSIFRACDDEALLERIRRLNLLAAEVSHETGAAVIDFDRHFAHVGARALQTDYRLRGAEAAEAAARIIVDALRAEVFDGK
jgi:hypothetical protein